MLNLSVSSFSHIQNVCVELKRYHKFHQGAPGMALKVGRTFSSFSRNPYHPSKRLKTKQMCVDDDDDDDECNLEKTSLINNTGYPIMYRTPNTN